MKKTILLIFVIFSVFNIRAQTTPITTNIIRQTYIIQTDTLQGTCFLIEVNNQEYLLTAKHLFRSNLHNGDSTRIIIYKENKSHSLNVLYYIDKDSTIDIAVLKLKESIKVLPPFSIEGEVVLGQDIYFLGYPNFNNNQFSTTGTIGILPLIKKGIISGWVVNDLNTLYFLDGQNNPGFSGGPAVCIDNSTHKPLIFGVISGYYYEIKSIQLKQEQDKAMYIEENSGIISCYSTAVVKQIITNVK